MSDVHGLPPSTRHGALQISTYLSRFILSNISSHRPSIAPMNIAKPIVQKTVPPSLIPPFLLEEKLYDDLAESPALREDVLSPSCM